MGVSHGAAGKQVVGDPTGVSAGPSLAVTAPPVEILGHAGSLFGTEPRSVLLRSDKMGARRLAGKITAPDIRSSELFPSSPPASASMYPARTHPCRRSEDNDAGRRPARLAL